MDMNYAAAAPEIFLGLAICVVLLVDVFLRDDQRETTSGGVGGGAASWRAWREPRGTSGGW